MRVGILTYHYQYNYGAVLQAYALQTYLENLNFEVFIIDYEFKHAENKKPLHERILKRMGIFLKDPKEFFTYISDYRHNRSCNKYSFLPNEKFDEFRKKFLKIEKTHYGNIEKLRMFPPKCDAIVVGSDQVWNLDFFDKDQIEAYFLNFGCEKIKRIAYVPSFAADSFADFKKITLDEQETRELPKKLSFLLSRFQAISVREQSGIALLQELGVKEGVQWLPDPTLLLTKNDWNKIADKKNTDGQSKYGVDYHLLHVKTMENTSPRAFIAKLLNIPMKTIPNITSRYIHPNTWLAMLRDAEVVLTNSFHGTVFSLIFRKNFITQPIFAKYSNQNDRLLSLLKRVGLEDRILWDYDEEKIKKLIMTPIDWDVVELKISSWRTEAYKFLLNALGE